MTSQMIPTDAIEAAVEAFYGDAWGDYPSEALSYALSQMRAALEAAAPHMLAEAWDEGEKVGFEESFRDNDPRPTQNPYRSAK